MDTIVSLASTLCLLVGSFLVLSGGVGLIRFPDFYSRMHAVGVTDTLAATMILVGLMLQLPETLVLLKLLLILLLTVFISPVASHALANAAYRNKLVPLSSSNENEGGTESSTS